MSRYIKNTLIVAAVQSAIGTLATPAGATDAVLVSDMTLTPLDAQNIDRALVRGFFGGSEQLVGPGSVKLSYSVELAGSGTAGTAPQWGKQLQACAVAEGLLTAPARVEYTPVSTGLKAMTQFYFDDGVQHKLNDSMGDFTLSAKVGERPLLKFDYVGLDGGVAAATDSGTYTDWKKPVAMTKANVVDITLGATYATGALTGGTVYASTGLEMKCGNKVNFTALLSSETVDITDRESTGSIELDLTAAQEVALMAVVKANTTQSLALTIGTTAGNKMIFFAPAVQLLSPKKVDRNGKRMIGFDLRFVPVNGNDEWRLVVL
jgi:hypothetical protein